MLTFRQFVTELSIKTKRSYARKAHAAHLSMHKAHMKGKYSDGPPATTPTPIKKSAETIRKMTNRATGMGRVEDAERAIRAERQRKLRAKKA